MAVPAGAGAVAVGQREMLLQITLLSDTLSNIYNTKVCFDYVCYRIWLFNGPPIAAKKKNFITADVWSLRSGDLHS